MSSRYFLLMICVIACSVSSGACGHRRPAQPNASPSPPASSPEHMIGVGTSATGEDIQKWTAELDTPLRGKGVVARLRHHLLLIQHCDRFPAQSQYRAQPQYRCGEAQAKRARSRIQEIWTALSLEIASNHPLVFEGNEPPFEALKARALWTPDTLSQAPEGVPGLPLALPSLGNPIRTGPNGTVAYQLGAVTGSPIQLQVAREELGAGAEKLLSAKVSTITFRKLSQQTRRYGLLLMNTAGKPVARDSPWRPKLMEAFKKRIGRAPIDLARKAALGAQSWSDEDIALQAERYRSDVDALLVGRISNKRLGKLSRISTWYESSADFHAYDLWRSRETQRFRLSARAAGVGKAQAISHAAETACETIPSQFQPW